MIFHDTDVQGAYLIELERHGDEGGFFARGFCSDEFQVRGVATKFVQVNDSLSSTTATLRGMHYQVAPHAETKMVRCIRGKLYDVALDLRVGSPTVGRSFGAELSEDNRRIMYVPKGCAHGFLTLEPDTEALYFVDEFYVPAAERGVRWDDPAFAIHWPMTPRVVSKRDRSHPAFEKGQEVVLS